MPIKNKEFKREDYSYLSWREAFITPFKPQVDSASGVWWKVITLFLFYVLFQFVPLVANYWLRLPDEFVVLATFGFIALSGILTIVIGRYVFHLSPLTLGREDYPGKLTKHWQQVLWTLAISYGALLLTQTFVIFASTIFNDGMYEVPTNQQIISESLEQYLEAAFFVSAIIAPVVEEYLFRGLLIRYLSPERPWVGLIGSTIVFSFFHSPTTWWAFLQYSVLGFAFGWVYLKTRRLEYPIMLHFVNNLIALIGLI